MAAGAQPPVSPETAQLLDLFCSRVEATVKGAQITISNEVQAARADMARQLGETEARILKTQDEIKEEVREQGRAIDQQGRDIVEVKTRLHEGEKRFEDHSQRIAKVEENGATKGEVKALEERVEKLETQGQKTTTGLAYLGGAAAGGGTVGAVITKLLGG